MNSDSSSFIIPDPPDLLHFFVAKIPSRQRQRVTLRCDALIGREEAMIFIKQCRQVTHWMLLAVLCQVFLCGGCATQPPSVNRNDLERDFAFFSDFIEQTHDLYIALYAFHSMENHWPDDPAQLVAFIPAGSGNKFTPEKFQELSFQPQTDGILLVNYAYGGASNEVSKVSGTFRLDLSSAKTTKLDGK
jgi:hypothetical protein